MLRPISRMVVRENDRLSPVYHSLDRSSVFRSSTRAPARCLAVRIPPSRQNACDKKKNESAKNCFLEFPPQHGAADRLGTRLNQDWRAVCYICASLNEMANSIPLVLPPEELLGSWYTKVSVLFSIAFEYYI
jgi:hypothetical protein